MKARPTIIFVSEQAWRVGIARAHEITFVEIPSPPEASIPAQVREMQRHLAELGVASGELVLALPSAWCLSATLAVDETDRRGSSSRALLFALEEQLPVAAEDVVADFLGHGDKVLGVCALRTRVTPYVEALEADGWPVAAICPALLLALSQLLASSADAPPVDALLAREADQWALLRLEAGHPGSWRLLPPNLPDLQILLRMLILQSASPIRLLVSDIPPDVCEALTAMPELSVTSAEDFRLESAAAQTAGALLNGRREIPVDLSLDGPKRLMNRGLRHSLAVTAASAAVCMVVLFAAFSIASWRLDRRVSALQEEQAGLFRKVVADPHKRAPTQVKRYLISEAQRLGNGGDRSAGGQQSAMALQMLRDLFARIPNQVSLQLNQLHVEADRAELTGQVPTHEDAGRLASALGTDGVLAVQPPQTSAGRQANVTFTMQVQRSHAARPETDNPGGEP